MGRVHSMVFQFVPSTLIVVYRMFTKSIKSVPFYFFHSFSRFSQIVHFVTTREGGVSEGELVSLNLSLKVNDDPLNVERNRRIVAQSFAIDPQKLIFATQCHSNRVKIIDQEFLHLPGETQNRYLDGIDAMVTNIPGVCICILTADCAAVLLYDPLKKVIGIAHAGWRGTVKQIAKETIDVMKNEFGCNPSDMVAAISPCIGSDVYEVGEEVAGEFEKAFSKETGCIIRSAAKLKPHIDITAANFHVLTKSGISPENIEVSGLCTFTNDRIFFSARRNAGGGGRFASGLMVLE